MDTINQVSLQKHIPVMREEVIFGIEQGVRTPYFGLDTTFGRGGHSQALLETFPQLKITALDQDQEAIDYGRVHYAPYLCAERLTLIAQSFHDPLPKSPTPEGWDFILVDLGVSSPQLDNPARGFSFYHDGPLDMRMNQNGERMASHIVNFWQEEELVSLFKEYGEIQRPYRVVQQILLQRKQKLFTQTLELAQLIERVEGWRRKGHHPATSYFLALRMEVNQELAPLRSSMENMMEILAPGGRLVVLTFHSLEDRIIKYTFRENKKWGAPVNKKVITPTREECVRNPRARSSQLRLFQRE